MFRAFLEANPALASCIPNLRLVDLLQSDPDGDATPGYYFDTHFTETSLFCGVLSLLPCLYGLEAIDIYLSGCGDYWKTCTSPQPRPCLKNLLITVPSYRVGYHIGDIIGCFDKIETLNLDNLPYSLSPVSARCCSPRDVRIQTLVCVDGCNLADTHNALFDYLLNSPTVGTLRALHIRSPSDTLKPATKAFIRAAGPQLRHLTCISLPMAYPPEWLMYLSYILESCPNLTSLVLNCRDTGALISPALMDRFITMFRPGLSLTQLSRFVLGATWYGLDVPPPPPAEAADAIRRFEDMLLQLVRSTALKAVGLMALDPENEDAMVPLSEHDQVALAGYFPRLHEHGLLAFPT